MTAAERAARTAEADHACRAAWSVCGGPETGASLVAVGGYGRGELAPASDLDLVLVHGDGVDPGALAAEVWYPLWDARARVDHAVRSVSEALAAAGDDLRVALGLLDARHVAGDPDLTLTLRATLLAHWRRDARRRLPRLRELLDRRHAVHGELAHAAVPDLKEAAGGLRDATVLLALVATWLVDVPHGDLERSRRVLLDVRDALHDRAGRAVDRVGPEAWDDLACDLGLDDAVAAQRLVREQGRRITHLSRTTWQRVDALVDAAPRRGARRPELTPLARGVALSRGEVVLDGRVRPADDPVLLLRAAAHAAERGAVLAPTTAARLAREAAPLPDPWPAEARGLLVRLLAAGPGLLAVWETLEETGAVDRLLPEWEAVRLLPHASPIHRFTVDRHSVETCIEASALIRHVGRPDVLAVAALLHDLGKGELGDHSVAGEPVARRAATRMGFDPAGVELVGTLVRHHLLLGQTATTRDPEDPATVEHVAARVGSTEGLALLLALTEADSRAASAQAWSSWRAGLVRQLAARVDAALRAREAGEPAPEWAGPQARVPAEVRTDPERVHLTVERGGDGATVTVVSGDRVGLLADVAAALALQRVTVRAARAWHDDGLALSAWQVSDPEVDEVLLRERLAAVVGERVDPALRLAPPETAGLAPSVAVRADASERATVLEVRAADRPGVLYLVCRALAALQISVRSAHVDTLGPQAVDVFYLQEVGAGALADDRAASAAHAVRAVLSGDQAG